MLKFKAHFDGLDSIGVKFGDKCAKAQRAVAEQVVSDTEKFVPFLTGSLNTRAYIRGRNGKALVVYPGPYARYLYYGKLMVDPDTGSAWASAGARKTLTDKNLVFNKTGHSQAQDHWFEASKAVNLDKWMGTAERALKKFGFTK